MTTILLLIIYLAFISLGLPDSLLGSAWPAMRIDLSAPLSAAGLIAMIVCGGTIVSSLNSSKLINRFGTGKITLVSVFLTAVALLGYSQSSSIIWLCVMAIPLGLGAGTVDAALNNFVALHYKSNHMSWLHCFWGVGATAGPIIMSFFIANNGNWQGGYVTIFIIQISLVLLLLVSLPLWKKVAGEKNLEGTQEQKAISNREALKLPGVKYALVAFFFYCTVEFATGLWGSSYLVSEKGMSTSEAAGWIAVYYGGITIGRLLCGFLTLKISNLILIRVGQALCLFGAILMLLPLPLYFSLAGFIFIGLGCAPIFPCMLHETPVRFGKNVSQAVMGLQMAVAYMGSAFMPPLLGITAANTSIAIFPYFLLVAMIFMLVASEKINVVVSKKNLGMEETV